jgi:hypothetical protein
MVSTLEGRSDVAHPTPAERLWSKVDKRGPDDCWDWTSPARLANGYGIIWDRTAQRAIVAHRFAYQLFVGAIPEGMELDHLCRNRLCVNPAHLEPVTRRENQLRGYSVSGTNARKTHCDHGHPFDDANTYDWRGHRYCRTCRSARLAARA